MPVENPQKDDITELQDQKVDNKELQDLTKKVEDKDFCQNFADKLKANEDNLVNAITTSVDKCNSDVQIQTLKDFLKSLENINDEYMNLKTALKTKIQEYEKTVDNTATTAPINNSNNAGTTNTGVKNIDFTTELPKLKKEIEDGLVDGTTFLDFAKNSTIIQNKIKTNPKYNEVKDDIANIKNIKDLRNTLIKCGKLTNDLLKDNDVKQDIETQLKNDPNNKITFDNIKQRNDYFMSIFQNLDKSVQNMTPQQLEDAIKNNTLGNPSNNKGEVPAKDYNVSLSQEVNGMRTSNEALVKVSKEFLTKLSGAKTQAEMNIILNDFIQLCDTNDDIKNDKDRTKLKIALEKTQSIPKEDIELVINSIQNGDLDFITAKIESNKKKIEAQEKLNKEQAQKDLQTYLNITPSNEKDIGAMADGLFGNNEARYKSLFDEDFRKTLTPIQQENLKKYIAVYLGEKNLDLKNVKFLSTMKTKPDDKDKTHIQSTKYPEGTLIIKIQNTSKEIVFGTQDQAQTRISDAYTKENPNAINDLGNQITTGASNESIINELNEKGSYITLEKIIKNKPETISKLLENGFINSLMTAGEESKKKLEEDNKKIREENAKHTDHTLDKPERTDPGLDTILKEQRDGYLNVINKAVLDIMNQPNITTTSPERKMFGAYMQSCNKDPRVLGASVDQRIASWNNIATRYKTFQGKNAAFFTDIGNSSMADLANREKDSTLLTLHKGINNDFNALWIHIKGEGNEQYGLKAQMKSLFESFKDEILMIAEMLGFDKEKIIHRCGFNKELKDQMTKFFKDKYELSGDKIKDIQSLSINNDGLKTKIKEITEQNKDKKLTDAEAIKTFRDNGDIKKIYIDKLTAKNGPKPSGDFIKNIITEYNAAQKNDNDKIDYLNYVSKINKNGKDVLEVSGDKRKELFTGNIGNQVRNLNFIWDNIAIASKNLAAMGNDRDRNGDGTANDKGSTTKTPEMAAMTIDKAGNASNEDKLLQVSYYLSSMMIGGHDKLEYTISENNDKKPDNTGTNDKPADKTPEKKEAIVTSMGINTDFIDTTLTTDIKITLNDKAKPVSINAIFTDFAKAPIGLKVDGKDCIKKDNTYVDIKTKLPVKINKGTTIEAIDADTLADMIVNNAIDTVTKSDKTNVPKDNYDKITNKDYGDKVIKPIFDLFTAENTYKSLVRNTTVDKAIKDPNTLKFMLQYSKKESPATGSAEEIHNKSVTDIIAKIQSNSKISFEQNTDKTVIIAVIKDKDDKITARREIGQGFVLKDLSAQPPKAPEQSKTAIDYTSVEAFRKSLGYAKDKPEDYNNKLETEFLKKDLSEPQKTMIAKEIAKNKIESRKNNEPSRNVGTQTTGSTILDGKVKDNGTLSFTIKKLNDTQIQIDIETNPVFSVTTDIKDIA